MSTDKLIKVARGLEKADLVVTNGKIVNVYTGEIYDGGVAVCGEQIAAIGDVEYAIGDNTKVVDAEGQYIVPGFIDAHIHPESSNLTIRKFAEVVLAHGTTSIMADLHEIGVVGGMEAMEAVLEESKETPLKVFFVVPSHIPFSPGLETSGAILHAQDIIEALKKEEAVGLSEIVAPYVLFGLPDLAKSMEAAKAMNKSLQGHAPVTFGKDLSAYLAAGVTTDHEAMQTEEALERVRNGCYLLMREGPVARNMAECVKVITEHKVDPSMVCVITDDTHAMELVEEGHMDLKVRRLLAEGIDFVNAIRMVSLNPARAFRLEHKIGGLAPGRVADINIVDGPNNLKVNKVIAKGKLIVDSGELLERIPEAEHKPILLNTVNLSRPVVAEDFGIKVEEKVTKAEVKIMKMLDWIPLTLGEDVTLPVKDGYINPDIEKDILMISVIERHHGSNEVGNAYISGFNLNKGAIASTVAHDNHNLVVVGTNREDMVLAANRLVELGGGQIVVADGKIIAEVAFPVVGLLSNLDAWELTVKVKELIEATQGLGSKCHLPFMFLSFIPLAAIPEYAITDKGLIHVEEQRIIDPIIKLIP